MVGKNLSHYKILEELGRGGMGIVYKAEDTKLDRTVAIKVLPSIALASEDDRARFYREAKAAAQLHHPHIASVFEIDEAVPEGSKDDDLRPFIAMEYIEGETLDAKIKEGPLKLGDAVRIASEIASALEAAHKKNIVHRDIKSQNVMLTEEGSAKVLDFGLAQTAQSTKLTRMGSTLGTIAYMSPEQARSEEVDRRTDIWSLGVVIYEMIAGKHPFPGDYEQAAIYSILNEDPEPLTALRTGVPMSLERLVDKCLAKSANRRFQSLSDFLVDIKNVGDELSSTSTSQSRTRTGIETPLATRGTKRWPLVSVLGPGIAIGLVITLLGVWLVKPFSATDSDSMLSSNVMHLELSLPEALPMAFIGSAANSVGDGALAISPDGTLLVYAAKRNQTTELVLHKMDASSFEVLPGTEDAYAPFFAPNGEWIAFAASGEIKKVRVDGGSPITLAPFTDAAGYAWADNGWIYFGDEQGSQLRRVPDSGGQVEAVTATTNCCVVTGVLPDSRYLLVYDWRVQRIHTLNVENGERQLLPVYGASVIYTDTGHLVYSYRGRLLTVPFDKSTLSVVGGAIPLVDDLRTESIAMRGQFDVSKNGTLIYATGIASDLAELVWLDANRKEVLISQPVAAYGAVSVSSDGNRLAVVVSDANGQGIQIIDLNTGIRKPLVQSGVNRNPGWSPDGQLVVYSRFTDGKFELLAKDPDGSTPADTILTSRYDVSGYSFSPDGLWLAYNEADAQSNASIWVVSMENFQERQRVSAANENHWGAKFSRDGSHIAYTSLTAGRSEIRVEPFPPTGERWAVSSEGGEEPIWLPNGNELVYRNARQWMVVSFVTEPSFNASAPRVLFEGPYINVGGFEYDVGPDGRFLLLRPLSDQDTTNKLQVVVNWFKELNRLAPRSD